MTKAVTSPWRSWLIFGLVAIISLSSATAFGQRAMRTIERSLKSATSAYDQLQLQKAEKLLKRAIVQAERAGLDTDPIYAELHVFLGVVVNPTDGDDATLDAFRTALEVDPAADIPIDYQTPTLTDLMDQVRREMGGGSPGVIRSEIEHDPVTAANAGEALYFEAAVPTVVPAYRVTLNYRRFGESKYLSEDMRPEGTTSFSGLISGDRVCSSQIDYYIEVLDRTENILVAAGSPNSPLTVFVFGGQGGCDGVIVDNTDPDPDPDPDSGDRQYVFAHLVLGGGFGLATGKPLANPQIPLNPGLAPAPFHIYAELGAILTPSVHLSAFMRNQFVLLQTGIEPEPIFGGKLRWWFDQTGPLTMYAALGGGFGFVRHTVDLRPAADFTDTARHGPAHGGLGFGFGLPFNRNIGLVADVYALVLFPTSSVHVDGNLGLRFAY